LGLRLSFFAYIFVGDREERAHPQFHARARDGPGAREDRVTIRRAWGNAEDFAC
jgi:hypothetical protein